jgi:acetyl-CoA carboxylase alpha subunit
MAICEDLKKALSRNMSDLSRLDPKTLLDNRYKKFRKMGVFV